MKVSTITTEKVIYKCDNEILKKFRMLKIKKKPQQRVCSQQNEIQRSEQIEFGDGCKPTVGAPSKGVKDECCL